MKGVRSVRTMEEELKPRVATVDHEVTGLEERSISKESSLREVSDHERRAEVEVTSVMEKPAGAVGGASDERVGTANWAESSPEMPPLKDWIR